MLQKQQQHFWRAKIDWFIFYLELLLVSFCGVRSSRRIFTCTKITALFSFLGILSALGLCVPWASIFSTTGRTELTTVPISILERPCRFGVVQIVLDCCHLSFRCVFNDRGEHIMVSASSASQFRGVQPEHSSAPRCGPKMGYLGEIRYGRFIIVVLSCYRQLSSWGNKFWFGFRLFFCRWLFSYHPVSLQPIPNSICCTSFGSTRR